MFSNDDDPSWRFYNHRPRYHAGLSRREAIEQRTGGDWYLAAYGVPGWEGRHTRCYGMPRKWGWSILDPVEGPRYPPYKRRLRHIMRKRARRQGRRELAEQIREHSLLFSPLFS